MLVRIASLLLLAIPAFFSASAGFAQARSVAIANSVTGTIGAGTPCTTPLVRNFFVSDSFVLADVDLGIRGVHTWRGDIRVTLQHPDGTRVQLVNGDVNNIDADNFNWRLDDGGSQVVNSTNTQHATGAVNGGFQNNYRPNNSLSAFNGRSSAGTWRLELCDLYPSLDNGTFQFGELYLVPQRTAGVAPALICPAGSLTFDWTGRTWNAGDTARNYTLAGLGAFNWSIANPGTYLNIAALGGAQPALTNGAQNVLSLSKGIDFANRTQLATTTITLGEVVDGAQFTIFDVDFAVNDFADFVRVTGRRGAAIVVPTLTNGVTNYVVGNEAFGDLGAPPESAIGNVIVTFAQPIDQIVIEYGNHPSAPTNPDGQAVQMRGGITVCAPNADLLVAKSSTVQSDLTNGTSNPFAIPGALLRYCILVTNTGSAAAGNIVATDTLPAEITYVGGTLRSGINCANANDVEDANNTDPDELDPRGASYITGIIGITATSLASGETMAVTYDATVN